MKASEKWSLKASFKARERFGWKNSGLGYEQGGRLSVELVLPTCEQ